MDRQFVNGMGKTFTPYLPKDFGKERTLAWAQGVADAAWMDGLIPAYSVTDLLLDNSADVDLELTIPQARAIGQELRFKVTHVDLVTGDEITCAYRIDKAAETIDVYRRHGIPAWRAR